MLQFIMDQNLLLYLCGAACVLGVVSQLLLRHLYVRLIGEIRYDGQARGVFLRQLYQRFQNCTHLNESVKDVDAFAERSIMDYQFWRMNLHQWKRLGLESLAVSLLSSGLGLWLIYRNGGQISFQSGYSRAALFSALLIALSYGMSDSGYLRKSLKVRICDYLQNTGAVKSYQEEDLTVSDQVQERLQDQAKSQVAAAKVLSQSDAERGFKLGKRRRSFGETAASRDKRELQENLQSSRAAAETAATETLTARENSGDPEKNRKLLRMMDSKEKEQILKEVLLEFLGNPE